MKRAYEELGLLSRMTQPARHAIWEYYIDIRIWYLGFLPTRTCTHTDYLCSLPQASYYCQVIDTVGSKRLF